MEWNEAINITVITLAITLATALIVRSYFSLIPLLDMLSLTALTLRSTIGES